MNIEFQPYLEDDKNYLWHTYIAAMKPHIEKMWGWDTAWQESNFEQSLVEYRTSILKNSSGRIGYLQVKCNSDSTFISMIILEPYYQSKGLGPKILEKVQSSQPDKPLTLRCFQVNQSAYDFYIRSGFEVLDTDDYFISMCRYSFNSSSC